MKNLILIVTDTFRYDNLGARAKRPVRTPELDRFAAERATEIAGFYTGSFPTIPQRTDMASGVLGWPHYGWQPIALSGPNHIAALLGRAGYATQLICDCPHLFNAGFQHAFNAAFQHRGQEGDTPLLHLNDPIADVMPAAKTRVRPEFRGHHLADRHRWTNRYFKCEAESFPAKTGASAVRWLEENSDADPFFLWVDFFDPHEPWDPPEYMVRRYDPDYDGTPMIHPNYGSTAAYTEAELRNLWAHYAAEAELVDRAIGRVLQKIDDLQLWDDSIVIVTSDHGTSLGEHERTGKSNICDADDRYWPIYPEVGHVPFLIAGADVPKGCEIELIAQPQDILPTASDLCRVPLAPEVPFQGRSFADAIRRGKGSHRDVAVSAGFSKGPEVPTCAVTPFVIDKRWGYAPVGAQGTPELFELAEDPLAERPLKAPDPRVMRTMHDLLLRHIEEHGGSDSSLAPWRACRPSPD